MADNFKLSGRIDVIQGQTTLSTGSDGTNFYGKGKNNYAGRQVATFTYNAEMDIRNITQNEIDNSIDLDFYGLKYIEFSQSGDNSVSDTVDLELFASLGNANKPVSVYHQRVGIASTFTTGKIQATTTPSPKHYHIEAGHNTAFADVYISRLLNTGTISNDEWKMYVTGVTNTNPPLYTPMSIMKGGNWHTLNKGGKISIMKGGSWVTVEKENYATAQKPNQGHNRIMHGGAWEQQSRIGD